MNDFEITKLCAEAMEAEDFDRDGDDLVALWYYGWDVYNPLKSNEHAMELVKALRLTIDPIDGGPWLVANDLEMEKHGLDKYCSAIHENLNRAICECVAKIQRAKQ